MCNFWHWTVQCRWAPVRGTLQVFIMMMMIMTDSLWVTPVYVTSAKWLPTLRPSSPDSDRESASRLLSSTPTIRFSLYKLMLILSSQRKMVKWWRDDDTNYYYYYYKRWCLKWRYHAQTLQGHLTKTKQSRVDSETIPMLTVYLGLSFVK